jgi:hypothetical protein
MYGHNAYPDSQNAHNPTTEQPGLVPVSPDQQHANLGLIPVYPGYQYGQHDQSGLIYVNPEEQHGQGRWSTGSQATGSSPWTGSEPAGMEVVPPQPHDPYGGKEVVYPAEGFEIPPKNDDMPVPVPANGDEPGDMRPRRRVCGMPLWLFLLLIAAVIIALGVGLGLGLGLKK